MSNTRCNCVALPYPKPGQGIRRQGFPDLQTFNRSLYATASSSTLVSPKAALIALSVVYLDKAWSSSFSAKRFLGIR